MTGDADLELDDRQLCPDGACIGVIGDDGRCKVCGRAAEGEPAPRAGRDLFAPADGADGPDESDEADEPDEPDEPDSSEDAAWDDERQLCPDGSCIGLLGPDGRCKVCGKTGIGSGS
jgi:hypothetical protein